MLEEKTGAGSSRSRCHCELEPTEALRRRWLFVDSGRAIDREMRTFVVLVSTGVFWALSVSEGWNTSSAGTFSPNVRTTRAILRLRASARLGSIGVVGVGGTSVFAESGERGKEWLSGGDKGMEFRQRTRGRGASPAEHRDLAANGIGPSSVDIVRRDSLDDLGSQEYDANSEFSE